MSYNATASWMIGSTRGQSHRNPTTPYLSTTCYCRTLTSSPDASILTSTAPQPVRSSFSAFSPYPTYLCRVSAAWPRRLFFLFSRPVRPVPRQRSHFPFTSSRSCCVPPSPLGFLLLSPSLTAFRPYLSLLPLPPPSVSGRRLILDVPCRQDVFPSLVSRSTVSPTLFSSHA